MDMITHGMLVISAVCMTVGLINLRYWFAERNRNEILAIAVACVSVAVYSWFELGWMNAETTAQFGQLLRWGQIPAWFGVVSLPLLLYYHLGAGRRWLLFLIIGTRTLGLVLNFMSPVSIHFTEITALGHVNFLGENLAYPIGVQNPLVVLHHLAFPLLAIFAVDAGITVWRRGNLRIALTFGGGVVLFSLFALILSAAGVWGLMRMPGFVSMSFVFLLAALALDLNHDLQRSGELQKELAKVEAIHLEDAESMRLSAAAADVGMWKRDLIDGTFTATEKWHEIFGCELGSTVDYQEYISLIHIDDRERVETALKAVADGGGEFSTEYRVLLANGEERWISSIGKVEYLNRKPHILRGVSVDVTKRKRAENAAHELSQKLMNAQEKERARLARELHDDLSQSLALLSINLQSMVGRSMSEDVVRNTVGDVTAEIERLSHDVHRISHELHPSKLTQLGLKAALRGFCREVASAHDINVKFEAVDLGLDLSQEISLCLYRITQEALRNVTKHSKATLITVAIKGVGDEIVLIIEDNGCGFDQEAVKNKESLGLVSMQERIRAVKGTIKIDSVTGVGTKIEARVPIILK